MNNLLKQFIKNNRDAFDEREPSSKVWNTISASLPLSNERSLWNSIVLWRVAAVLLLGVSIYQFVTARKTSSIKQSEVVKIQKEFSDQELFYRDQISEKVAFIEDYENAYDNDHFTQDFQKLEAMYQVLLEEMKTKPSEKMKDALILNMLVRIDLLNQLIKRLEDSDEEKQATRASS